MSIQELAGWCGSACKLFGLLFRTALELVVVKRDALVRITSFLSLRATALVTE